MEEVQGQQLGLLVRVVRCTLEGLADPVVQARGVAGRAAPRTPRRGSARAGTDTARALRRCRKYDSRRSVGRPAGTARRRAALRRLLLGEREPEHGGVAQHGALPRGQPVDLAGESPRPSRADRPTTRGSRPPRTSAAQEQRVAARARDQLLQLVRRQRRFAGAVHASSCECRLGVQGPGPNPVASSLARRRNPPGRPRAGDQDQPRPVAGARGHELRAAGRPRRRPSGGRPRPRAPSASGSTRSSSSVDDLLEPRLAEALGPARAVSDVSADRQVQRDARAAAARAAGRGGSPRPGRAAAGRPAAGAASGRHPEHLAQQGAEREVRRGRLVLLARGLQRRRRRWPRCAAAPRPAGTCRSPARRRARRAARARRGARSSAARARPARPRGRRAACAWPAASCADAGERPDAGRLDRLRLALDHERRQGLGRRKRSATRSSTVVGGEQLARRGLAHHPGGEVDGVALDRVGRRNAGRSRRRRPRPRLTPIRSGSAPARSTTCRAARSIRSSSWPALRGAPGGEHDLAAVAVDVGLEERDVVRGAARPGRCARTSSSASASAAGPSPREQLVGAGELHERDGDRAVLGARRRRRAGAPGSAAGSTAAEVEPVDGPGAAARRRRRRRAAERSSRPSPVGPPDAARGRAGPRSRG